MAIRWTGLLLAGMLAASQAGQAGAATADGGASLSFDEGNWDPFTTCVTPPGEEIDFTKDILRISSTGGSLDAGARVEDPYSPREDSSSRSGRITYENATDNAVCTVFDVIFDGAASAWVSHDDPFEITPTLIASGRAEVTPNGPAGAFTGTLGQFFSSGVSIDSDFFPPPPHVIDPYFSFDAFSTSGDLILGPGDVVTFDVAVSAMASANVPLPAPVLMLGGALGALAWTRRLRRNRAG